MPREHLTSSQLAAAAERGTIDPAAREHTTGCLRCAALLESAQRTFENVGGPLGPHPSLDLLLAWVTEALSPNDAAEVGEHVGRCESCAERTAPLRPYSPAASPLPRAARRYLEATKIAARSATTGSRRGRLLARAVAGLQDLLLTLCPEPEDDSLIQAQMAPIQLAAEQIAWPRARRRLRFGFAERKPPPGPEPSPISLGAGPHTLRLRGSRGPGGPRLDLEVHPAGIEAADIGVELSAADGKTYSARTGVDGRATLPLPPGRSVLRIATRPAWELEIDFADM